MLKLGRYPPKKIQSSDLKNVVNEDVEALKDTLENLNTRKSTSRKIVKSMNLGQLKFEL